MSKKYPRLELSPNTKAAEVIRHMQELAALDKSMNEEQLEIKVLAELAKIIQILTTLAYESSPNPETVSQVLKHLDAERILKSALTGGDIGKKRLAEVFTKAESYVDDALDAYMVNTENEVIRKKLAILKVYLRKASFDIIEGLEEARSMRGKLQQRKKRISSVLSAVSDPRYSEELYTRSITNKQELEQWTLDVKEFFVSADKDIAGVQSSFRNAYVREWDNFIATHFMEISHQAVGTTNDYESGRNLEKKIDELLNKQLIKSTQESFKIWAEQSSSQETKSENYYSQFALSKIDIAASIEFKRTESEIELWIKIPRIIKTSSPDIRRQIAIDMGEVKHSEQVMVKLGRREGFAGDYLILSLPSTSTKELIEALEGFLARKLRKIFV
jgi:hypothetical protein